MKEPQLSLFKGYPDTVPDTITLQGIINLIQNDPSVHDHTKKYCYYHEQGSLSAATRKSAHVLALPLPSLLRAASNKPISKAGLLWAL